jgi:histidyl-tRNA synthetase
LEALRAQGACVVLNPAGVDGPASPKSQFKKADASGAQFALVFGPDEVAQGQVAVKPLRGGGEQVLENLQDAALWAQRLRAPSA